MENPTDASFVNLIIAGMLLAFVLATAIILFVFFYQRKVAAQKNRLQTITIDHQKSLIHATLRAVEEERRQFATNLHDEIGAHLAIAKMTLGNSPAPNTKTKASITFTVAILNEAIDSVQSISHNLFPPVLAKLGLEKAIESYLRKIPETTVNIELNARYLGRRFDRDVELHAFRIFQESLSNALKHSDSNQISIELIPKNEGFALTIQDNGKGFDEKDGRIGMGLQGMRSRAEMIDYNLKIDASDSGVKVELSPFRKSEL